MLRTLLTLVHTYKFSNQLTLTISKNPYIGLDHITLATLLQKQLKLKEQHVSIEHTNKLIYLGSASSQCNQYKDMYHLKMLLDKCMSNIHAVHQRIQEVQERELLGLDFQEMLVFVNKVEKQACDNTINSITTYYANTYTHILPLARQLQIYDSSRDNLRMQTISQLCRYAIGKRISSQLTNLSTFTKYLRLFHQNMKIDEIKQKLSYFVSKPHLTQLNQTQKLIFNYLMIRLGIDVREFVGLAIVPDLRIYADGNAKATCLKLEILRYQHKQIGNLDHLQLHNWNLQNLLWLSQFSPSPTFTQTLHKHILSQILPYNINPICLLSYAQTTKISEQKHIQLSKWLMKQQNITIKNEDNLCQMLLMIHDKHWFNCYKDFYIWVLKMSLGNFKWESQNIVYYVGCMGNVDDQNMEYLRRYILNTYAALGTARREIPTSSYFYKILAVTNVEKFYGNL